MIVGVSDKLIMPWLKGKEYLDCSDEGEAVAIAAGNFLATGKRATAFMSADGFCNALNFLTSWIMPEGIEIDFVISTGRTEDPHKVMTKTLPRLLNLIRLNEEFNPKRLSFTIVEK